MRLSWREWHQEWTSSSQSAEMSGRVTVSLPSLLLSLQLSLVGLCKCEAPPGWENFPLTVAEVRTLAADQTRRESLTSYNNNNQSCLISPARSEEEGGSCTWRSERLCRRVPTVRTVPVFSPWCSSRGEAGHLTRSPVDSNL